MANQTTVPTKPEVPVRALVASIAEDVLDAGWRVASHTEKVDHEREESRLTVVLIKGDPRQGTLKLHPEDDPDGD
jgi:hypothetical protein